MPRTVFLSPPLFLPFFAPSGGHLNSRHWHTHSGCWRAVCIVLGASCTTD